VLPNPFFCLVTDYYNYTQEDYLQLLEQAICGGVNCIQLRDKHNTLLEQKAWAEAIKRLTDQYTIPLIINDLVDLACAIDASGVHLGQQDSCPKTARAILGENKYLGLSIETIAQLQQANQLTQINYVAASAVFSSTSKTNCNTTWGLEGLRELVRQSVHPVIAIGGINSDNTEQVMQQGAQGVAVISYIHQSNNPFSSAQKINHILHKV
jgi:thiamine-phosphate pyrophosphorylase